MTELEPTRIYSNPTATDELLTLLKEHGVEHYEHEAPATDCVAFFDGNGWHDCWESVDGEVNVTFSMAPEQAIAATLGATDAKPAQVESSGTCHDLVHVVRCRDCVHGHITINGESCKWCDLIATHDIDGNEPNNGYDPEPYFDADFFCAWGRRADG